MRTWWPWSFAVSLLPVAACLTSGQGEQAPETGDAAASEVSADQASPDTRFVRTPPYQPEDAPGAPFLPTAQLQPQVPVVPRPAHRAQPLSGGTLLVLRDGKTAVASDPDRDVIWVADLAQGALIGRIPLRDGDVPGRLVEGAPGEVHVSLRQGGGVVRAKQGADGAWTVVDRREVCPAPRGLAFDAAKAVLHVACAGGELVTLPAEGGPPVRRRQLDRDLRDVVVSGDTLFVTTFRSAELLALTPEGEERARQRPPVALNLTRRAGAGPAGPASTRFEPAVAWRTIARPGGVLMLHQRGFTGPLSVEEHARGGYGGPGCEGIVQAVITPLAAGQPARPSPVLPGVLAIDLALKSDGQTAAVLAMGDAHVPGQGSLIVAGPLAAMVADAPSGCAVDPLSGPPSPPSAWIELPSLLTINRIPVEAVALAYDGHGEVVVHVREPAEIRVPRRNVRIPLATDSVLDTGHALFHSNSGGGVACASCHPESGEDGRVWTFTGAGRRRTQSLRGGVSRTAPLHWDGDLTDLDHLAREVFTRRMGGPELTLAHREALARWVDDLPLLPTTPPADSAAVERGRTLFNSPALGCATCHAGPRYTNNLSVDVGTGKAFQVPGLPGVAARAPFTHDGCAATLGSVFTSSCGGARHAVVESLTTEEKADLMAFLESL